MGLYEIYLKLGIEYTINFYSRAPKDSYSTPFKNMYLHAHPMQGMHIVHAHAHVNELVESIVDKKN